MTPLSLLEEDRRFHLSRLDSLRASDATINAHDTTREYQNRALDRAAILSLLDTIEAEIANRILWAKWLAEPMRPREVIIFK